MTETLNISTERVDDIPLLLAQMQQMEIAELVDCYFPRHGNWLGLSPGGLCCIWLSHILSQADHRLSYLRPWAEARIGALQQLYGQQLRALDFTDDRLANLLELFSNDEFWAEFEAALNRRLIRVYDLPSSQVRCDSTTASGYWQVSPDGLFQFGRSADKRPDLPQLKVSQATLDPLPLPLITNVLAGQCNDEPLYRPLVAAVSQSISHDGVLFVGDCKMAALLTRADIHYQRHFYLCPLAAKQLPDNWQTEYLAPVQHDQQPLTSVKRQLADGTVVEIAHGYERSRQLSANLDGRCVSWTERQLVVCSLGAAKKATAALQQRLERAQSAIMELGSNRRGKKRISSRTELDAKLAQIIEQAQVAGLLTVTVAEQWQERPVRRHKERPAYVAREWAFSISVAADEQAVAAAVANFGWRVYATNREAAEFGLEQAVLCYWEEYLVEQSFGRLKGAPLSLSPLYLQRDDHAVGLVRLLSLGVRVLALVEYVVRQKLAGADEGLAGLYAGQPKAATRRPTTERLLRAFAGLTLTKVEHSGTLFYHLTPLSELQQRILQLIGFSPQIYTKLAMTSVQLPSN
jgi:transposase